MKNSLAAALSCGLAGLAVAMAAPAQSTVQHQVLHDNGPYITHPGGHASGSDASQLQNVTFPANTAQGFAVNAPRYRLTDDFVIPASTTWTVDRLRVYAYQAGGASGPFSSANVMIWYGQPGLSFLVYDGRETNALISSEPVAYRVSESEGFTPTTRHVQAVELALPNVVLTTSGHYYISWQLSTASAGAIFTPQVTILGQIDTVSNATAGQFDANLPSPQTSNVFRADSWINPIRSGIPNSQHRVDLPFVLSGYANDRIFLGTYD